MQRVYVYLNIYLSLFVYTSPEKPQWGVAIFVYIFLHGLCLNKQSWQSSLQGAHSMSILDKIKRNYHDDFEKLFFIFIFILIICVIEFKTAKTNDKIRRFGVVMTLLSRKKKYIRQCKLHHLKRFYFGAKNWCKRVRRL